MVPSNLVHYKTLGSIPLFLLSGSTANMTFFSTLPCTCKVPMSVPQSDSPANNCFPLLHLLFIRKAANYKLFSFKTCPDWLERRILSNPDTSAAQQGTWHSVKKKSSTTLFSLSQTPSGTSILSQPSPLLLPRVFTAQAALLLTVAISDLNGNSTILLQNVSERY